MSTNLEHQPHDAGEVSPEFQRDTTREIAYSHGYQDALGHHNEHWLTYVGAEFEVDYDHGYGAGMCDVRDADVEALASMGSVGYVGRHRSDVEPRPGRARRLLSLVGAR